MGAGRLLAAARVQRERRWGGLLRAGPGGGGGGGVFAEYQECQASWILLPGFELLPAWLRIVVYFLCLVWCFFGVAIISDVFMSSIEVITSAKRTIMRKDPLGHVHTIEVAT